MFNLLHIASSSKQANSKFRIRTAGRRLKFSLQVHSRVLATQQAVRSSTGAAYCGMPILSSKQRAQHIGFFAAILVAAYGGSFASYVGLAVAQGSLKAFEYDNCHPSKRADVGLSTVFRMDDYRTGGFEVSGERSKFVVDVYGLNKGDAFFMSTIESAMKPLSNAWDSTVPVNTRFSFTDLGAPENLASGGGVLFVQMNATNNIELVPVAAAESILRKDINGEYAGTDKYDVLVKVNRNTPWFVGPGKQPRNAYDLFTILIHEVYHNLMLSGAVNVEHRPGRNPVGNLMEAYPARFDLFLANEEGCSVLGYLEDAKLSKRLKKTTNELFALSVTNDRLYFYEPLSGLRIPLFAPQRYMPSSSVYHTESEEEGHDGLLNRNIPIGSSRRAISADILAMQKAFLDMSVSGAKTCVPPLGDPTPFVKASQSPGREGRRSSSPEQESKVLGLPIWAVGVLGAVIALAFVACIFVANTLVQIRRAKEEKSRKEKEKRTEKSKGQARNKTKGSVNAV